MLRYFALLLMLSVGLAVSIGCSGPPTPSSQTLGPQASGPQSTGEQSTGESNTDEPVERERVKAESGVGEQSIHMRNAQNDNTAGFIATPAVALFDAKEKIVFSIQIPQLVNLYAASSISGKGPQSHEEFMEKIINENRVELPQLPPGQEYVWDVEKQTLMVDREKQ